MVQKNITKNVVFEPIDYRIVKTLVKRNGFGARGFSAALRQIIREWDENQKAQISPTTNNSQTPTT